MSKRSEQTVLHTQERRRENDKERNERGRPGPSTAAVGIAAGSVATPREQKLLALWFWSCLHRTDGFYVVLPNQSWSIPKRSFRGTTLHLRCRANLLSPALVPLRHPQHVLMCHVKFKPQATGTLWRRPLFSSPARLDDHITHSAGHEHCSLALNGPPAASPMPPPRRRLLCTLGRAKGGTRLHPFTGTRDSWPR